MRLLHRTNDGKVEFTNDIIRKEDIPPYAILSHTWGEQEVLFGDLKSFDSMTDIGEEKHEGWNKIQFCAQQAERDGLEYFWVDTCCIDKANYTELTEAINSMFRWYQNANKCYVFLSDVEGKPSGEDSVSSSDWETTFKASRWFTRGWTLQELLAPRSVEFFSRNGVRLGDKGSLCQIVHEITQIPIIALSGSHISKFEIAERFSWARNRQTTREEDEAYCLLGILGCNLPLIYGEGKESALRRLRKQVQEGSEDVEDVTANSGTTDSRSLDKKKLNEIRSWLSVPDPSTNHYKAHRQRQAETGLWLLHDEKFTRWKSAATSRLWLYGIPGCGKTILSSTIIEHLLHHCSEDDTVVTVYFYFDFNDAQKQNPELMLRSILNQLLQCSVRIPGGVSALFSSCGNGQQQPSLHSLLEVAPQVMQQFTHIHIVLDALDECTQRLELMDMLKTVDGWQLDNMHLLVTSRKERDIEMYLETFVAADNTVCLQRDVVDRDILRYVKQKLCDDKRLVKWNKDDSVRQEVEIALMQGAQGMFRWAVCQLDTIARCRNLAMLRRSLATLPQTLDQTYERILNTIAEEDCAYALRILQWLTFSARPLSVEEIAEVVAIDFAREPAFRRDEVLVDPLDALDICSSLVTITMKEKDYDWEPAKELVSLAHYSVKEYLVSDRIKQGSAKQFSVQEVACHRLITKGCLGYLNQFQSPIPENALAQYSAKFWHSHLRMIGDDVQEESMLAMSLLSSDNPARLAWLQFDDPDELRQWSRNHSDYPEGPQSTVAPLYYAAILGLETTAKLLLEEGVDINTRCGTCGSALEAASVKGHISVVRLLIDRGADVNASCGLFGTALRAAIRYSHETTTRLLLERGADVGPDRRLKGAMHHVFDNPLCTSSMVSLLQEYGAPLDTVDVDNMTPLHYCAKLTHEVIAKQLIDAGVPVDIRAHHNRGLHECEGFDADDKSRVCGVGNLLPVSKSIGTGLTPLHLAAFVGDVRMIIFFLEHGADPNAVSEHGETPLHLTFRSTLLGTNFGDEWVDPHRHLRERRKEAFEVLMVHPTISVTATDCQGDGLLHCMPYNSLRSADCFRELVSRGVDVFHCNLSQQSPLHLASRAGNLEIIDVLVGMGADVASTDECGLNAFHYAAQSGRHDIMMAILDIDEAMRLRLIVSRDKSGRNVLHHALSDFSEIGTIRWLLDQGANGSEPDDHGLTPLTVYIKSGIWNYDKIGILEIDIDICKLLLQIGENASFVDHHGQTLGHLYARTRQPTIHGWKALRDYHVDLTKRDHIGQTVLHHVAEHGSLTEEVFEFFVGVIGIQAAEQDKGGCTALQLTTSDPDVDLFGRWGLQPLQTTRTILSKYRVD